MVHVHDKRTVFQNSLEDLSHSLLPGVVCLLILQCPLSILDAHPLHKIINILEMIIKGHAADPALLAQIIDRDLVDRLLQKQLL